MQFVYSVTLVSTCILYGDRCNIITKLLYEIIITLLIKRLRTDIEHRQRNYNRYFVCLHVSIKKNNERNYNCLNNN